MPLDPSLVASGIQAGAGLIQGLVGMIGARKRQRELENFNKTAPQYQANRGIMDYYNQALARYNVQPGDSALYKRNMQNINRNLAGGMMGLQDRRSSLAGLPALLRASNDAALNTEVAAEQQRNQRFGELGGAAQMKAGEERMEFDINKMQPFERKFNLLAQRAGAANQLANTGLSNVFGGIQNYGMMKALGNSGSGQGGFFNTSYGKLYR